MTTFTVTAPVAQAPRFAKLAERYRLWREYRRTVNELSELSDRDLADFGLSRGMIRSRAIQAVYGE